MDIKIIERATLKTIRTINDVVAIDTICSNRNVTIFNVFYKGNSKFEELLIDTDTQYIYITF